MLNDLPIPFQKCILRAIERNSNDTQSSIDQATEEFPTIEGFDELVDSLIRQAISNLVYKMRHELTKQAKRDAREYGSGAKVKPIGISVSKAYLNFFDSYFIGGKRLGDLTGDDIDLLINKQRSMIAGHTINLKLLEWVKSRNLKPDQKLRDVIDVNEIRTQFNTIEACVKEEIVTEVAEA